MVSLSERKQSRRKWIALTISLLNSVSFFDFYPCFYALTKILAAPDLRSAFLVFRHKACKKMESGLTDEKRRALVDSSKQTMDDYLAAARQPPRDDGVSFPQNNPEEYHMEFEVPVQKVVADWSK
jgi:hypothetical protein